MKLALAQVNPLVGDVAGNTRMIRETATRAAGRAADLVVFPEMVVTGYPPLDLLERPELSEASALHLIAASRSILKGRTTCLFPQDLDENLFGSPPIELGVVDGLVGAEIQISPGDRQNHLMAGQDGFEMGRRVAFGIGSVVSVIVAFRH